MRPFSSTQSHTDASYPFGTPAGGSESVARANASGASASDVTAGSTASVRPGSGGSDGSASVEAAPSYNVSYTRQMPHMPAK